MPNLHAKMYSCYCHRYILPKVVYDQPAERKENNRAGPEYPFVLPRSPLNHSDRITTYTQCVGHIVQPLLGSFQNFSLFPQVTQDCSSSFEILI